MLHAAELRREFPSLARLAWPIVLGEFGWATMALVDTIVVGRLSTEALGGVSIGNTFYFTIALIGFGILLALDTKVSQAFGAGNEPDCRRWLRDALYLCLPMAPILMGIVWLGGAVLEPMGVQPAVRSQTIAYLNALNWSTLPFLFYAAARRYLQSMGVVKPVMLCMISANVVNLVACWALVFGKLGLPELGVAGAGWATSFSRWYMALVLFAVIALRDRAAAQIERMPNLARMKELIRLGFPAAAQLVIEVGVFSLVSMFVGRLEPKYLAAHHVALSVASYTFMVPLGIGSAAAVRVGQALGRKDRAGARTSGFAALVLGTGFMSCSALCMLLFPGVISRIFTSDPAVLDVARGMLAIAAAFQVFDGLQAVATGALRGAGETRIPAIAHFCGYWLIGLPVGYWLCFHAGWNAAGMWVGMCAALMVIGSVLARYWVSVASTS